MSQWGDYKATLFCRRPIGVYRWRGWTTPILRIGRWELRLTRWTHQEDWRPEVRP